VIVGFSLILGLTVAWALGAKLTRLADVHFRGGVLVFLALGLQVAIYTPLSSHVPGSWDTPVHGLSYLLLISFFLLNMRVPGFWLVGFGLISNVVAIFANGGYMPVSAHAWAASGNPLSDFNARGISDNNTLAGPHTHLAFLSDVFAVPSVVPHASVLSIGDFLVVIGMVAFVYRACVPPAQGARTQLFAPLRSDAFRRVIAGRLVSSIGDWLTQAACVTWIYSSTKSVALISAFLIARTAAYALGGLASAPMLDRLPGFATLSVVEALRGGLTVAMLPFAAAGQIWPVIGLGAASLFLAAATSPTAQGLIPDVLPSEQLQAGNAIHQMARSLTSVIGALVGGFAVVEFSIQTALCIDLVTFLAAAVLYRRLAGGGVRAHVATTERVRRRDLFRAIAMNRVVFGLTASFTLVTAAVGIFNSDLSRAFDTRLGDAHAYGYVLAVISAGYMCSEILTGTMRRESVARRSVGLSFMATGGALYLLSYATTLPIAYMAVFLFGASDGVTEVVRDSLIQLNTRREVRSGVFAMVNSIQTGGMVVGLAAAPVIADRMGPGATIRVVAAGCVVSAIVAAVCLVGRGGADEVLDGPVEEPSRSGDLGVAVAAFTLHDGAGTALTLQELTVSGPAVIVLDGAGKVDESRVSMLREIAEGMPAGARLVVVGDRRSTLGQRVEAVRVGAWLRDPSGEAYNALRVPRGRRVRDAGVFVIDGDGVLRLAYRSGGQDEWIPASFVLSRLRRLMPAEAEIRVLRTELHEAAGGAAAAAETA
jgi:predicted MFS family arabinose efflux permease